MGAFECAQLADSRMGCHVCLEAYELVDWRHAGNGFLRCPKCCRTQRVPEADSPFTGYLGLDKRRPDWCPGFEPVPEPVVEEPTVTQLSLFG